MTTILDTLNTFIGFAGIMLLLSLIVTALVQFLQSSLSLRARNLRIGLQSLIESVLPDEEKNPKKTSSDDEGDSKSVPGISSKELTKRVLDESQFVSSAEAPNFISRLLSPATTWVEKEELVEYLKTAGVKLGAVEKEKLGLLFRRMEAYLNKRFTLSIRIITFLCAILVAGYFQVNAPELIKRLASNAQYRASAVKVSEQLNADAPQLLAASTNYQNVPEMALAELAVRHPDRAEQLERASGLGESRADIVGELRDVLTLLPASERDHLVAEYEKLLSGLQEKAVEASGERLDQLTDRLSAYDITPWMGGLGYYSNWTHVIGVIITAIFLSLGAPFWYERLRELIQLRDALKPKPQSDDASPAKIRLPVNDNEERN